MNKPKMLNLKEFGDKRFQEGFQKSQEMMSEIIKNWGTHKCGWGDDSCDYIDEKELLSKIGGKE